MSLSAPAVSKYHQPGRLVAVLVLAGLGTFMAYTGAADWYGGMRSAEWPTATGVVRESEVERRRGRGRRHRRARFVADVSYDYTVGDRTYFGDRISFGYLANPRSFVRRHPPGTAVQVHYDAARPSRSVLRAGWRWRSVVLAGFGLVTLIGALVVYRLPAKAVRSSVTRPEHRRGTPLEATTR